MEKDHFQKSIFQVKIKVGQKDHHKQNNPAYQNRKQKAEIYSIMEGKKASHLFKIIVIGDSGVGKTNLITCFCDKTFKETYVATIGVDFKIQTSIIGDKKIKMQIWDTAGQERFKNITQAFYRGAVGILLAYSITDKQSFLNVSRWMEQIDTYAPENVCIALVGTKNDLEIERAVLSKEGQQLGQKFGIPFLEVSAKLEKNVKKCFESLAINILNKMEETEDFTIVKTGKSLEAMQDGKRKSCQC